jgi:hypothetical protein
VTNGDETKIDNRVNSGSGIQLLKSKDGTIVQHHENGIAQ